MAKVVELGVLLTYKYGITFIILQRLSSNDLGA